jgi:5-methylcytosine-specific restriction endonuclease McrA
MFGTFKCQICGNTELIEKGNGGKAPNNLATIEHVIPKALGGLKYNDSNFIHTCYKCNMDRELKPLYLLKDNMYTF